MFFEQHVHLKIFKVCALLPYIFDEIGHLVSKWPIQRFPDPEGTSGTVRKQYQAE
jgi:hypothetical protein